jgi:hypothetical protein
LAHQGVGFAEELLMQDDAIDQIQAFGFLGIEELNCEQNFKGDVRRDAMRQRTWAAGRGDATLDLRLAEDRPFGSDPDVAG